MGAGILGFPLAEAGDRVRMFSEVFGVSFGAGVEIAVGEDAL